MPINPLGHNNPSQRQFTSGAPQENEAAQADPDTQSAREEQARQEGAVASSSRHAMSSPGRDSHLQRSLLASISRETNESVGSNEDFARYLDSLDNWVNSAPAHEREIRENTRDRIVAWQAAGRADAPLDLSATSLREQAGINEKITELPPLPPRLQKVNVSGNRLESLAAGELPDSLKELNVSSNRLIELPENLPVSLEVLDVGRNRLQDLPEELPPALKELNVQNNRLDGLPEELPPALKKLNVRNNALISLPENLPASLEVLDAGYNRLEDLPFNLPAALKKLYVRNNSIFNLPEDLPVTLEVLDVQHNQLVGLPVYLPAFLKELNVRSNNLVILPNDLPAALEVLNVGNNYLKKLPESFPASLILLDASQENALQRREELMVPIGVLEAALRERNPCRINLRGTRISAALQQWITAHNERVAQNGTGREIEIVGGANRYGVGRTSQTLGEAVRKWYNTRAPGYAIVWREIRRKALSKANEIPLAELDKANEEDLIDPTRPFWALLDSLSGTKEAKLDSAFRERVTKLLDAMEGDEKLCATCFNIAQGGDESCHDNVTLTFNQMEQAHLARCAAKGDFTPQEVFELGVNTFKLQMLDELAIKKAREVGKGNEELEVVLYYRTKLAERLNLRHQPRGMIFESEATTDANGNPVLDASDLDAAADVVQSVANNPQRIIEFLTEWEAWQEDLARRYPKTFNSADLKKAQDDIYKDLGELDERSDLDDGEKLREKNALMNRYNNLDAELFGPERERLTREFVMGNVASSSQPG